MHSLMKFQGFMNILVEHLILIIRLISKLFQTFKIIIIIIAYKQNKILIIFLDFKLKPCVLVKPKDQKSHNKNNRNNK